MNRICLNLDTVQTRETLHTYLQEQMAFPDHYGRNLDALYDMLTTLHEDTRIEIHGMKTARAEEYLRRAIRVMQDAAAENPHLSVTVSEEDRSPQTKDVPRESGLRILVVNDDGVGAHGIEKLAALAAEFGRVTVVAPAAQCSAMSQRITIHQKLRVREVEFPVEGVEAYSVEGTPADCVKLAVKYILRERRPEIVFSGINDGYNTGIETLYSGTIGACMEALVQGIPAIAWSNKRKGAEDAIDLYWREIADRLLRAPIGANEIWNVNFPGVPATEINGILWDRTPEKAEFFDVLTYGREDAADGGFMLWPDQVRIPDTTQGTDIEALLGNYISVGRLKNMVL